MELELEQLRAETEATKAETRAADNEAIAELVRSGAEAKQHNEQRVQSMASAEIHRQKNT